jgi:hypothetical protein
MLKIKVDLKDVDNVFLLTPFQSDMTFLPSRNRNNYTFDPLPAFILNYTTDIQE